MDALLLYGKSGLLWNFLKRNFWSSILNNEYVEQDEGVGVEALKPIAYCRTIDVPNIAFGNRLDVSAIKDTNGNILKAAQSYTIVNIQADRTGFSALMLEEI